MNRRARLCAAAACLAFVLAPLSVHALAGEPDLSSVQIELADLPSGFRAVPDSDLVEVGGSAKQVGEALERSLAEASLQQYLVYASDSGDELLELVVVGPLIAPERVGMSREMADSSALADDLMPSFTLYVEQSEPRIIDTAGIGEASVGFTVDSRLTSDLATVTNILGVPWTSATSQFLLALRGEYVVVMMTQHVGSGAAGRGFPRGRPPRRCASCRGARSRHAGCVPRRRHVLAVRCEQHSHHRRHLDRTVRRPSPTLCSPQLP
jgi:hypothetical protein